MLEPAIGGAGKGSKGDKSRVDYARKAQGRDTTQRGEGFALFVFLICYQHQKR